MSDAVMLDARLRNVLTKKAGKFKGFLVEENEMWAEWFDLLLLCSAVNQSGIVAKGDGEEKIV